LANSFASAVVQFFDGQDPREVDEAAASEAVTFAGEIPEFLPFPEESRAAIARDLPEVYENPSLSSRNLFRSDVDLDGDGHLDMALLVRLSRDRALGVVLAYTPKQRFEWAGSYRVAGKFACDLGGPGDFERCFQVLRTESGAIHIASYSRLPVRATADAPLPTEQRPAWRLMRLQDGELRVAAQMDAICEKATEIRLQPLAGEADGLVRVIASCPERRCEVWRYRDDTQTWSVEPALASHCEDGP
jgi:hypothetical protein